MKKFKNYIELKNRHFLEKLDFIKEMSLIDSLLICLLGFLFEYLPVLIFLIIVFSGIILITK